MYFSNFPVRYYMIDGKKYLLQDIFKRIKFTLEAKLSADSFLDYTIKDYDNIRKITKTLYDSVEYEWIILLFNNIYDYYDQWPLSNRELEDYAISKYGLVDLHSVHHYVNTEGDIVDSSHPSWDRSTVSNYKYEEELNDSKRNLKILKPEYLNRVLEEFRKLVDV